MLCFRKRKTEEENLQEKLREMVKCTKVQGREKNIESLYFSSIATARQTARVCKRDHAEDGVGLQ